MPVSYQYLRTADGQPESLGKVEDEMCKATGVPNDPRNNCSFYEFMLYAGAAMVGYGDGFTTSQEAFDKFRAVDPLRYEEHVWELIHRFTVKDYNYTCWR
jgi:hypothetical protein